VALVDLHLHTTSSDGRLTPTELIHLVAKGGLEVISITDHDSTEGLAEALEAAKEYPQLKLIPGIEMSADIPGNEIHILAYYIRYEDEGLQNTLQKFRDDRIYRAKEIIERLRELGMALQWERVQEIAGDGAVGRPHIALAMVEKGYVTQTSEAFDRYLGRNGPAYSEREKLTPVAAIELVRSWGGVAVLAHPSYVSDLDNVIPGLIEAGLVGMEVYYARYPAEKIQELAQMADRYGLVPCGGSDYHGMEDRDEPLPGSMGPPLDVVKQLEQRASSSVTR